MRLRSAISDPPVLAYYAALVIVAFASSPNSFALAWNEGRSAMLAIVPLVLLEMWRDCTRPLGSRKGSLIAYFVLLMATLYYTASSLPNVRTTLASFAVVFRASPDVSPFSWVATVDYAVGSLFVVLLSALILVNRPLTPAVYMLGTTSFLFVDTVLPYDALGPLQSFVPPMLQLIAFFVNTTPYGHAFVNNNVLLLSNPNVSMDLEVFWPSAGLHGVIIATLAVAAIAVKLRTGWWRGLAYLIIGIVGSGAVNVARITLLAFYALGGSGPTAFERFHSAVGEIIFLPWVAGYLYLIVKRERRRQLGGSRSPSSSDHRGAILESVV
ncbi:MAG: archaeosortase/exosortase family protein [Thaumarchaeota archaeon]|nr:archaeosortase/exosortase family protein [Nitrososphaerota archaeon]